MLHVLFIFPFVHLLLRHTGSTEHKTV